MSEQIIAEKPQRPAAQGRYRYLADLNRQDSPNLRKLYRDSVSSHGRSNRRSSSSHRRHSPYQSSHKRSTFINRGSPSCSTFKPRREITQEQFSPYDDRAERQQEKFNQELVAENAQLRSELNHVNQINQSLKLQLTRRQGDLVQLREASQADLKYFEKVVAQMTGEIQLVLTKNKILENQLVVAKARLHEELRRNEQIAKVQEERRVNERKRKEEHSREERRSVGQIAPYPQTRRSVGKLIGRANQEQKSLLGTSKIKIEDESEISSVNCQNKPTQNLPVDKQAKKGEELIESIRSMYLKIKGEQSHSLRELWKWLKSMGQAQSSLKRWKHRVESGSYLQVQRLRQLLKEGCSYIQ